MSFSKETKRELCALKISDERKKYAFAYGMALFSKYFSTKAISFTTGCKAVAVLYAETLSALTSAIVETSCTLTKRREEKDIYTLSVPDSEDCGRIFDYFGHVDNTPSLRINRANIESEEYIPYFLRGAFLVCGNVTDPEKDYHMEFVVPHMNLANDLSRLMSEIDIMRNEPSIVRRKGSYIVYLKGSDLIADMLTYIGAPMASLDIIQQQIYKSVRNKVNRQINSETANSNKTAAAAARQLRAIGIIREKRGLGYLSEELRELAQLREENPEYNLRELGEALSTPISRSGVNHRIMKIMEIAQELSETEN